MSVFYLKQTEMMSASNLKSAAGSPQLVGHVVAHKPAVLYHIFEVEK